MSPNRKNSPIRGRIFSIALVIVAVVTVEAIACSIPVFRYALENWRPDPYVAYVLHRDELTAEQQALLKGMQSTEFAGTAAANLVVKTVHVDAETDETTSRLVAEYSNSTLPQLILRKPGQRSPSDTVFAAEFTSDVVAQVMDSPLRTDIKDRLLKGDSVVWVYLECGRPQEDDEAFTMLSQELGRLQNEIELPEIEDEDLDELTGDPELLEIRFSAVRLSRDDAQESVFRDMLLHVEPDLMDAAYVDEPMAFPVFGRGRVLYALVGDGLVPDLVEEACRFLTGACQCTVKAENPGVDLMMQVEWDRFIKPTEAVDASLPPLAGFSGFGQQADEDGVETSLAQTSPDPSEESSLSPADPEAAEEAAPATPTQVVDNDITVDTEPSAAPANAVWRNGVYVLLVAGVGVMLATLLLLRRAGG